MVLPKECNLVHYESMRTNVSLSYNSFGKPEEVLSLQTHKFAPIQDQQVLIKLLASVIHPSDFGKIQGTYGKLATLPAVAGREGVGIICEVGSKVSSLKVGMRVRIPETLGTWQSYVVAEESDLWPLPSNIPVEQLTQAFINPPTALRLLNDFVPLKSGDWVIQNAANSCVGQCVIQIARVYGYKTINVVRNLVQADYLKHLGADCVITLEQLSDVREWTNGEYPKLALNSVGGSSALRLIKSLAENGTMVTFGAMTGEAIRFPTRELIFKNIQLRGFWMDAWSRLRPALEVKSCLQQVFNLMQTKKLVVPVGETYPLEQWKNALEASQKSARNGKVLFLAKNDD